VRLTVSFRLPKASNCACLDEGKGRFEEYTIFLGGGTING